MIDNDTTERPSRPARLVTGISTLLGSMPGPDCDGPARDLWLATRADLLDQVADAAATTELADDCRTCATAIRAALGIPTVTAPSRSHS